MGYGQDKRGRVFLRKGTVGNIRKAIKDVGILCQEIPDSVFEDCHSIISIYLRKVLKPVAS